MTKLITFRRLVLLILLLAMAAGCHVEDSGPIPAVPEFSQTELENHRGKPVILNFWAIWCMPCRSEMPALEAVHQRYQDQGLVVLAVNVSESSSEVGKYAKTKGLTFPHFWDRDQQSMKSYEIRSLPTTLFIDRTGTVVHRQVGAMTESYLKNKVEPLLQ
jgi:thiol-disulfide isomerase/thioredoxin